MAPLHGALKVVISLRLKDDLIAEIDRVAAAHGQTRSAWIAQILTRTVLASEHDDLPIAGAAGRLDHEGHSDEQVRVTVRLNRREIEAIDIVGAPLGLSRNEWIKRALRWQLWDKAAQLRLCPAMKEEVGKVRKQILLIGRNINQAVHAMNAANQPESSLDIARIAEPFLETCADLKIVLHATRRSLSAYVGGEVAYWTGAFGAPRA
ncbi:MULTISPECIES: ribbon-helix-helix domain-containing protein [Bacteria]|jgi:metal-responsive CopG/Arc/MetJ family transcriptional regulator|uniref:DNA binding CopG/RHH family protein n=1 Tax=Sphingomonas aquatilis TaxID=93063 RepID=A0AAW3TYV7_9SPHN|nr:MULTISPECIES: ribbon-helix-helix domain-containing protein [Bacteria]MBB3877145.1 putative DNA binding CopG/RHH family protein [Sphingomonas aquatilis]GEM72207.1 hypothetical protein SAQ01S_19730 [Sphingomonas aquatilis NBRC 16722]